MTTIVWFRQDLRLNDNPALFNAASRGPVVPVYIFEGAEADFSNRPIGSASRWWLHHSLSSLQKSLKKLVILRGNPLEQLDTLIDQTKADAIYWNRCYEPGAIQRDKAIKEEFCSRGLDVQSFNASLLHEPWQLSTRSGSSFKVYTPFWKALQAREIAMPLANPDVTIKCPIDAGIDLEDLKLTPVSPNWAAGWEKLWNPGESGALMRLDTFLDNELKGYGELRDRPDRANVSRLSPHLHFGEISPRQVWTRTQFQGDQNPGLQKDISKFLSEIAWREFSYHLLYHFPELPERNWRSLFDAYPWRQNKEDLLAWQRGMTGYPFVDAGMRELWQTGYMHNRVRMVAASFLVKHLQIHWREGESWFWDTLVDADLANNTAGWQWVAGSGTDAAPYFRIFNPITQGRRFDPEGTYVRQWCPELSGLDNKIIHAPFEADKSQLLAAGIELGTTYPDPIVNHAEARARALAGYETAKIITA